MKMQTLMAAFLLAMAVQMPSAALACGTFYLTGNMRETIQDQKAFLAGEEREFTAHADARFELDFAESGSNLRGGVWRLEPTEGAGMIRWQDERAQGLILQMAPKVRGVLRGRLLFVRKEVLASGKEREEIMAEKPFRMVVLPATGPQE